MKKLVGILKSFFSFKLRSIPSKEKHTLLGMPNVTEPAWPAFTCHDGSLPTPDWVLKLRKETMAEEWASR